MGLSKCSDCGGSVSTRAMACPHCGAPVSPPVVKNSVPAQPEFPNHPLAAPVQNDDLKQTYKAGVIGFVVAVPLYLKLYSDLYESTTGHTYGLVIVVSSLSFAWNIHSWVRVPHIHDVSFLNWPNILLLSVFAFCVLGFGWTLHDADPVALRRQGELFASPAVGTFAVVGTCLLISGVFGGFLMIALRWIKWRKLDFLD